MWRGWALVFSQAIQDITRIYDDPPEEIVTLIYERIDINNEGMTQIKIDTPWKRKHFLDSD